MGNMLKSIPIGEIRENVVALRSVNRETEEYKSLVDSVARVGILNAINVRLKTDPETKQEYYELVDGLHRFSAAKDAGLSEVPAQVLDVAESEVAYLQIIGNAIKVETRPVEYSKALRRILAANPLMTELELASKLSKSPQFIKDRLGLTKISDEKIAKLVDDGTIKLMNAFVLAKLDPQDQVDFVERAMTMDSKEFGPLVQQRIQEVRASHRQGRDPNAPPEFIPVAHMQKLGTLKEEMDTCTVAKKLIDDCKPATLVDAFQLGIKWALHLDPLSIAAAKAKEEERQKMMAEAKHKRDVERAKAKAEKEKKAAEEAAANAAKVAEELAKG